MHITSKRPAVAAPTTVSGAVRLAIADGRALLARGDYQFESATWHSAGDGRACAVCAAGAVMARQFDIEGKTMQVFQFDDAWNRALRAINAVRGQCYVVAYAIMAPGAHECGDALAFARAVRTALGPGKHNRAAQFTGAAEYTEFLDWLESAIAPAIEHAEAVVARHRRTAKTPAHS